MELQELRQLIAKYNAGQATPAEQEFIEAWYDSIHGEETVLDDREWHNMEMQLHQRLQSATGQALPLRAVKRGGFRYWRAVAAAALILVAGAGVLYVQQHRQPVAVTAADLAPGTHRATLITEDGQHISLVNNVSALVPTGKAMQANGLIRYNNDAPASKADAGIMNTISTPRGGTYEIVLTDGTKVWLNAASSLRFPVYFAGNERTVTLDGEAYFEVAPDAAKPFHVITRQQRTDVLGTHFNINAYTDEPVITTTLTQGSVRVTDMQDSCLLQPGSQALLGKGRLSLVKEADTATAMAWQHEQFAFNNADISAIMRQLGRWYDVDVVFDGPLPAERFSGKISRNVKASTALQVLAASGINFKIEGRKIILK